MNDFDKKQYIFKQAGGRTIRLFHQDKAGICASVMGKNGGWLEPSAVIREGRPDFNACMDEWDVIHIICQDSYGSMLYLTSRNGRWALKTVPGSKSPGTSRKHLSIIPTGDGIYIFYIAQSPGKNLLTCQYINAGGVIFPQKVIGYVPEDKMAYLVLRAGVDQLSAFYVSCEEEVPRTGVKEFSIPQGRWGKFTPVGELDDNCELISSVSDKSGSIYLCFQKTSDSGCELCFAKKAPGTLSFDSIRVLNTSAGPCGNASILSAGGTLIVYWTDSSRISFCMSSDRGVTWSKPSRYTALDKDSTCYVCYSSNDSVGTDSSAPVSMLIPANLNDGFKPGFIGDDLRAYISSAEIKDTAGNTLKAVPSNVDDLKSSVTEAVQKVKSLERFCEKLSIQVEKLEIKIGLMGNELSTLKNTLSHSVSERTTRQFTQDVSVREEQPPVPEEKNEASFSAVTPQYLKDILWKGKK